MARFGGASFSKLDFSEFCENGKRFITQGAPAGAKEKVHKSRNTTDTSNHQEYIAINVSGVVFKTRLETLSKYPATLLGNPRDRLMYQDEKTGEVFLDRHAPTFPAVLYYYQSDGQLHRPPNVNYSLFKQELTFYKIKYEGILEEPLQKRPSWTAAAAADGTGPNSVDPVNSNPAYSFHSNKPSSRKFSAPVRRGTVPAIDTSSVLRSDSLRSPSLAPPSHTPRHSSGSSSAAPTLAPTKEDPPLEDEEENGPPGLPIYSPISSTHKPTFLYQKRIKQRIYDILEHPETSTAAKIFSWISMSLIVCSVAAFIAETMPNYKKDLEKPWQETTTGTFFFGFESACILFFTVELVGRFLTCPKKKSFSKNKLNIIDLISILPYYLEQIIPKLSNSDTDNVNSIGSLVILRVLRLFRVLRIFKLSRHSKNMLAFGIALNASLAELLSLGLFMAIDIVVFSSAVYYSEMEDEDTKFTSIPAAAWWAVVTVTTLGYGDMCPETAIGKLMGSLCVFSGILVIAFQMPIMVAKFTWTFMQNTTESPEPGEEEEEELSGYEEMEETSYTKPVTNGGTHQLPQQLVT